MKKCITNNCSYNDRLNAEILATFFEKSQPDFSFFLAEVERLAKDSQLDPATIFTMENLANRTLEPYADPEKRKGQWTVIAERLVRDARDKREVRRKVNERLDSEAQAQAAEHSAVVQLLRDEEQLAQKRLKWMQVERCLTRDPLRFPLLNRCWDHFERTGIKITQSELGVLIGKHQSTVYHHLQAEHRQLDKALAAPEIAGMDL